MSILFVDTETTGLDPDRHEVWEIALIDRFYQRTVVGWTWDARLASEEEHTALGDARLVRRTWDAIHA